MIRFGILAMALLASAGASCAPYVPGPVSSVLDDGAEGRIYFASRDVYDFADIVDGTAPPRTIHGDLTLPPEGVDLRGAVILSHGSGGPGSLHRRYAAALADRGLATFLLDHFGPRGVGSTARDQIRITAQGMMTDVRAAQALLATHPRLDADRIGHVGWSKGGITAVIGSVQRLSSLAGSTAPLAFAVAYYPFCGFDLGNEPLASPLLIQIGAEDDWTPAPPCRDLVSNLQAAGQPAEIVVYPGARHGFDSQSGLRSFSSAITVRDRSDGCRLTVDAGGRTITLDGALDLSAPSQRVEYLKACGTRGVTYSGDDAARTDSQERLFQFIDAHLP